jgi:hypothetical protein
MARHDDIRDEARRKLRLAANASDPRVRQELTERAFELAQRAEAMERAAQAQLPPRDRRQ